VDLALTIADRLAESYDRAPVGMQRWDRFDPNLFRASCLIELDRFADADRALTVAVERDRPNYGLSAAMGRLAHGRLHLLAGRWDEAVTSLQACHDGPDPHGIAPAARGMAALIAVHRGTFQDDMLAGAGTAQYQIGERGYLQFVRWAAALVHETAGDPGRALAELVNLLDGIDQRSMIGTVYDMYPDALRLATMAGDKGVIARLVDAAERLTATYETSSRRATALLCRGVADHSIELVGRSTDAYTAAGRPLYAAQAYETLAVMPAGDGKLPPARAALETALDGYSALGVDGTSREPRPGCGPSVCGAVPGDRVNDPRAAGRH
jgi:hypothetical protein